MAKNLDDGFGERYNFIWAVNNLTHPQHRLQWYLERAEELLKGEEEGKEEKMKELLQEGYVDCFT